MFCEVWIIQILCTFFNRSHDPNAKLHLAAINKTNTKNCRKKLYFLRWHLCVLSFNGFTPIQLTSIKHELSTIDSRRSHFLGIFTKNWITFLELDNLHLPKKIFSFDFFKISLSTRNEWNSIYGCDRTTVFRILCLKQQINSLTSFGWLILLNRNIIQQFKFKNSVQKLISNDYFAR